ncbi:MAG: T9SS type A sorting domain-containing protein [Bacteroidota bacterium]
MKKNFLLFSTFLALSLSAQVNVLDINPGAPGSGPSIIGTVGSGFWLNATTATEGSEPWYTDGTAANTKLLKDINKGTSGSTFTTYYIKVGSNWFFVARDTTSLKWSLWKSDGTSSGTQRVKDLGFIPVPQGGGGINPILMVAHKGTLFFSYEDPTLMGVGKELWKSDGTLAGTVMVKDINSFQGSDPTGLISYGDYVYFFANDGTVGNELWRSDGTSANTTLVKDIYSGSISSYTYAAPALHVFKGMLYFGAQGTHDEGIELYRTDGTSSGTSLFMDINTNTQASSFPAFLNSNANYMIFRAADGVNGNEPWISDGTVSGTKLLKDIATGSGSSTPYSASVYGNKFVFSANDVTNGTEYWITDGTSNGTSLLKDINPGAANAYPSSCVIVNNKIYFTATDTDHGTEIWYSDGTTQGTQILKDIVLGTGGSNIFQLFTFNNQLYFNANIGDGKGSELYTLDPATTTSVLHKVLPDQSLIVFPNPAKSNDIISISGIEDKFIQSATLLGMDGKIVQSGDVKGNNIQFANQIAAGVYWVQITTATTNSIVKLIISE